MKIHNFLAFDIGATSGRSILATFTNTEFEMKELTRFPNRLLEIHGKYYWDICNLYSSLKEALVICGKEKIELDSIGIDTWGVDFGCIAPDGTLLGLPRAYRDPYTEGAPDDFFTLISKEEVYDITGIQVMSFNSLFQLYRSVRQNFGPLKNTEHILFMPDLLSYLLTGKQVCEYTDASTSQLLNVRTRQPESRLFEAIGLPITILPSIVRPGVKVGGLTNEIARETNVGEIPVVAVAGHDTASAVVAVPARNPNFAYLSSGTWSLMGIETENPVLTSDSYHYNFTNEGGVEGTIRFLKNITGMWLLEQCRKEWEQEGRVYTYQEIVKMASEAQPFRSLINPDDPRMGNPSVAMSDVISNYCIETGQPQPQTDGDFVRCIFESLALRYKEVLIILDEIAPFPIEVLHVIGGGARNQLLNQFTSNAIGRKVVAGPAEATAIGNAMIQAKAAGLVNDRWEIREIIAKSEKLDVYHPKQADEWLQAYNKYKYIITKR